MAGNAVAHRWGPDDQRQLLAALRKPTTEKRQAIPIALHAIVVLNQPRKTFTGIPELADSIALQGLIHAPSVALLGTDDFRQYLQITDRLWGTSTDWRQFRPMDRNGDDPMYAVLLAGERRLRACRHLWDQGCSHCHDAGHDTADGRCFHRHFGGPHLDVTLYEGIGAITALNLQYSENTHHPVPIHEEAEAYFLFFRLLREVTPSLTLAAFARQVGRHADWIRRALAFCDALPEIQDAVRSGHVSYSVALELHRLSVAGFKDDDVRFRLHHLLVSSDRTKSGDFRRQVSKLIVDRSSGQGLLELMSQAQERASRRAVFRRTLGGTFLAGLRGAIEYLLLVAKAISSEELGRVYAFGSVRKNLERLVVLLEEINAHRLRILSRRWAQRLRKATAQHHALNAAERKDRRPRRRP